MRRSQLQLLLGACLVLFQVACGADTGDDLGIYLGSHPSLTGDGSAFVFEWNDSIWMASTTGGVARCLTQDGSWCESREFVLTRVTADGGCRRRTAAT